MNGVWGPTVREYSALAPEDEEAPARTGAAAAVPAPRPLKIPAAIPPFTVHATNLSVILYLPEQAAAPQLSVALSQQLQGLFGEVAAHGLPIFIQLKASVLVGLRIDATWSFASFYPDLLPAADLGFGQRLSKAVEPRVVEAIALQHAVACGGRTAAACP